MKIRIWGARGSIPAPMGPEEIREKLVSALLGISQIASGELREELIAAILEDTSLPGLAGQADTPETDQVPRLLAEKRRQVVERYLDTLPPLHTGTAGGNTPCIEIQSDEDLFIIDAGSGIRQLGLELMKGKCGRGQGVLHLFFSHPHWDHIQGFPFFRPAFVPGNKIYIYSVHDLEAALRRQQEFISFPVPLDYMQAQMSFIRLNPEEVLNFGDLRIRLMRNYHPGDAYSFRFEKWNKAFVYASDAAYPTGIDLHPYLNFFTDADVLIFDAQFTQQESDEKEDWGHSSPLVGVELAQQAKVKNLVLYHHNPAYTDADLEKVLDNTLKFQQTQYPAETAVKVMIAQEGQTFNLTPPQTTQLQVVPGGKAAILKPVGIFNEHMAAELRRQMADLQQTGYPVQLIIDMSEVELLQVVGLRDLVKLHKEQPGTTLVLAGPSLSAQQVIELVGYLDFFAIYPSVHTALSALQAREALNLPGQTIKNRYYIQAKINDGWLGTAFRAKDTRLNRTVVLKILSASFSEVAIERFLRHAREIIDLTHPNIVNILDCDEDRGLSYMIEEFIEGQTLRGLLNEQPGQPFPLTTGLFIAIGIIRALEYAHTHGVVHGDLKPSNVLLAETVKISDFGLGRLENGKSLLNLEIPLPLVTAQYLAPEQVLGHPIDVRTDLYALGVVLYEVFTGRPLFTGTDQEVLEQHLSRPPQPPRQLNPAISPSLEHLILKLLDKDPNKRYPTARQVRRILVGIATATGRPTQEQKFPLQRWPALVGRAAPLQQLLDLWGKTRQGQGQLVLLHGESGLGKTRLCRELVDRAGEATILQGRCLPPEISLAYQPFLDAFKTYLAGMPPELAEQPPGQILHEAALAIPEFNLQPPPPQPHFSLAGSLKRATAAQPWLLILDDMHWTDPCSQRLLEYLAQYSADTALMIVAVYNDELIQSNPSLPESLDQLKQHPHCTVINLTGLTESNVKELLEALWQQPVPAALVATISRRTRGNPLFIEEVAKSLVDEGIVIWREGRWDFNAVVEAKLPQHLPQAISRRIYRLPKESQTLLQQAAVLGYTFTFDDLLAVSHLAEWDILENLDIPLERYLLQDAADEGTFRFYHPQIQQALLENLSSLKQHLLHREAGEALEQRCQSLPGNLSPILADHFLKARDFDKGLAYCLQAATQAEAVYANQTALNWYNLALDMLDQSDENENKPAALPRFELLLAREQIYDQLDDPAAQAADLSALQRLAQTLNDPAKQAIVHIHQAHYERIINQSPQAITEAQAALIAARQANNPTLEGESLLQLAYISIEQGIGEMARAHMHDAHDLIERAGSPQAGVKSLNGMGDLYRWFRDYPQAETFYQRALALSLTSGNRYGEAQSRQNLGSLRLDSGDYEEAFTYTHQALILNQFIGHRRGEAACRKIYQLIMAGEDSA